MTQSELHHETRLAYSTISELYHGKTRRIDIGTLESLCEALDCGVADIIEYTPAKPRRRK